MQINWLDDKRHKAEITRGFLKKYRATVYRDSDGAWFMHADEYNRYGALSWWLTRRLEKRRKAPKWELVVKPPKVVATYRLLP